MSKIEREDLSWSSPLPLNEYLKSERSPGIYIIGSAIEPGVFPTPSNESNDYLGNNFPDNFKPEYVGISESYKSGVKSRLSVHARKKGSKHIAQLIEMSTKLYFIGAYGDELTTMYESQIIMLKGKGQFEGNVRLEYLRDQSRRHERIHALLTGRKLRN